RRLDSVLDVQGRSMSKTFRRSSGQTKIRVPSSPEAADSHRRRRSGPWFLSNDFAEGLRAVLCSSAFCTFLCIIAPASCLSQIEGSPIDPQLISIFPPGGRWGTSCEIEIRGRALSGASSLTCVPEASSCEDLGIRGQVTRVEPITSAHT